MADAATAEVPPCTCGHPHAGGTRCDVCGHHRTLGFLEAHELPRPPGKFIQSKFDLRAVAEDQTARGHWNLSMLLRGRLVEDLLLPYHDVETLQILEPACPVAVRRDERSHSEQDQLDAVSRHLLGRIGDVPVSYLRWRPAPTGEGQPAVAIIDRLYVLRDYRRRRVGYTTILNALVDILEQASLMQAHAQSQGIEFAPWPYVSVFLPEEAKMMPVARLLALFGFVPNPEARADDPSCFFGGAAAGQPPRVIREFRLQTEAILPTLQAALAAGEGVRPAPPIAPEGAAAGGGQ